MVDEAAEEKPKKATFLKKAERAACWEAKDNLWACWDKGDREACEDLREVFKLKCPPMWVNHFDRKYDYINFKKKLYSEGADSVDQKFEEKR